MSDVRGTLKRTAPAVGIGVAIFVMLMTWAIGVPRFGAPDEPAHVYKAFGVAHGELLGEPAEGFPGNLREFDAPISLEVCSTSLWEGPAVDAAVAAADGMRRVLATAWVEAGA